MGGVKRGQAISRDLPSRLIAFFYAGPELIRGRAESLECVRDRK